ncbi:hypothetical protein NDU88_007094 [Pleurodeles waltl]|uniref:Uncharacterized protein n=1 Tax=Pleurodeles waltl TaxID=8319 RepID=A0AAV7TZF3_PLEWA|nr:hypothetical protein NDU88_007094 [Pleurodeles waltl]
MKCRPTSADSRWGCRCRRGVNWGGRSPAGFLDRLGEVSRPAGPGLLMGTRVVESLPGGPELVMLQLGPLGLLILN